MVFGVLNCLLGNLFRLFGAHLIDGNACLLAYNAQLVNCCGAVDITGYQQWAAALGFIIAAQLCRMGCFTVTLQAAHHHNGLALIFDVQGLGFLAAHQLGQFLVDDLDNLLGGGQAFHHFLAHGALRNLRAEILCDFVVDVRFKQRHADFPHRSLDIRFTQLAFAAQFFENAVQTLA